MKTVFLSVVLKSKRSNVQCVLALKESKLKYLAVLAELISLVLNTTVKVLFHFIHFVLTSTMLMQKLTQLTVNLVSKYGSTVEKFFLQRRNLRKEANNYVIT
ncbi:conserved hypothetical protein [Bacillus sp. 349Y]|nr:conserved hypothetical protein [Bacillus sp. 349Y]